MLSTLRRQF